MDDPQREQGRGDARAGAAAEPGDAERQATVEAVLFATDTPLKPARIAEVAELGGVRQVRSAIEALNARYEQMGCAFRIEEIAGGYQLLTLPEYHDVLSRLLRAKGESRLSQAALETLAIVAYRQPILRADVEAIRGVACGEVLRGLMDRLLVKIVGRAELPGRPMLYGTTRRFLEAFGLASLDDLPRVEQLRQGSSGPPAEKADAPEETAACEPPPQDDTPPGPPAGAQP
jgi:segregation and condensation protein B